MKIQWHGETSFTITGKNAHIAINNLQDAKANIHFCTRHQEGKIETDEVKVFDWPGEYEAKGVSISTIDSQNPQSEENLVFYFEIDNIKVCHLGHTNGKLTPDQMQEISESDILLIPINKETSIDAKKAHEIIEQIEPRIVIPTDFTANDESYSEFVKEMGLPELTPQASFDAKGRSNLPDDRTDYVLLEKI